MARWPKIALVVFVTACIALAGAAYVHMKLAAPAEKLEIPPSGANRGFQLPPGEPVPIKFVKPGMTPSEVRAFLTDDFKEVRRVTDLPAGVQKLYMMNDRPRTAIADPGKGWQKTDAITDPYLPRRRLIFAGVTQDRAFVYYEEGGIGLHDVVDLFRLDPPATVVGLWRGYCDPGRTAANPVQVADDCNW